MSKHVENLVWRYAKVPPSEKLVLLKLADAANPDGTNAYPSLQEMAEECYLSKRTIQRALDQLQAIGVIEVQQVYHPGRHVPTTWRVRVDILTTGNVALDRHYTTEKRGDTADKRGDIIAGASGQRVDSEWTKRPRTPTDPVSSSALTAETATTEVVSKRSGVVEASVVVSERSTTGELPLSKRQKRAAAGQAMGQAMVATYHDLFLAKYGRKPVVTAKDGQQLKRVAVSQGVDQGLALLKAFFQTRDKFVEQAGHTVGVFGSTVNKLIADQVPIGHETTETIDELGRTVRRSGPGYVDVR